MQRMASFTCSGFIRKIDSTLTEAVTKDVLLKKGVLKNFVKFTGKHLCQSLFFNKVAEKETLVQVFSCEFCGISKNTFFTEHLQATAFTLTAHYGSLDDYCLDVEQFRNSSE